MRFARPQAIAKAEFAYEVLGDGGMWQRREAIRYLIENRPTRHSRSVDRGALVSFFRSTSCCRFPPQHSFLFSESRRMGYRLEQTDKGYRLDKKSNVK